jgi:hypothetical protein
MGLSSFQKSEIERIANQRVVNGNIQHRPKDGQVLSAAD